MNLFQTSVVYFHLEIILMCHVTLLLQQLLKILFNPSNVLLAISTTPPAGLATTPINPLPTPLKKPPAPSDFAPKKHHTVINYKHQ